MKVITIKRLILRIVIIVLLIIIIAQIATLLWNAILPVLFAGIGRITFWKTLGLVLLIWCFFPCASPFKKISIPKIHFVSIEDEEVLDEAIKGMDKDDMEQ